MKVQIDTDGFWQIPEHVGPEYVDILSFFHKYFRPQNYLEIGTQAGVTLKLARKNAIAVDPAFRVGSDIVGEKDMCLLFQTTSDHFFSQFDISKLLGGPVHLAFLDGMHWFEYLLRDFMNIEKYCVRNSIVLLHDCAPTDAHVARRYMDDKRLSARSDREGWWAGDVWKAAYLIKKHRPELRMYFLNTPPTGLIAITNLNPDSDELSSRYFELIEDGRNINNFDIYHEFLSELPLIDCSKDLVMEIAPKFYI